MSYKLSGSESDMVRSLAIHQDAEGLITFIQALVDKQAGKPLPPDSGLILTNGEIQLVEAMRQIQAE